MNLAMIIVIIGFALVNLSLYANVPFLDIRNSSTPFVVSTRSLLYPFTRLQPDPFMS